MPFFLQVPLDPAGAGPRQCSVYKLNEESDNKQPCRIPFYGLHRKPIKLRDKKFALFTEATGAFPVSRGSEDAESLPVQVLETRADK